VSRKIEIVEVRNEDANLRLYVLALIALARQIQQEEAVSAPQAGADVEDASAIEDDDGA
jgi:hypothetical protein